MVGRVIVSSFEQQNKLLDQLLNVFDKRNWLISIETKRLWSLGEEGIGRASVKSWKIAKLEIFFYIAYNCSLC